MKSSRHLILLCLLCFVVAVAGQAQSAAAEDGLLDILRQQVDSLFQSFPKGEDKVYFLSYRVEKSEQLDLSAAMGSVTGESNLQNSLLTIQIRVGNPHVDNYSVLGDGSDEACLYTKSIRLPLDDNQNNIRKILVRETSAAYQEARVRYRQAMAADADIQAVKHEAGDYVHSLPMAYYEPPFPQEELPVEVLKNKLKTCSGAVSPHLGLQCSAVLNVTKSRRYFVSSDGAALAENAAHTCLRIQLVGQTKDGTLVPYTKQYDRQIPGELPADEDLSRDVQKMEQTFQPVLNSKSGDAALCPVVFSESASGIFWQSTLVPFLLSYDGPLGWELLLKPFKVGDFIEQGTYSGFVEKIQIFCTSLRTYDNRIIVVPNTELATKSLVNHFSEPMRRVHIKVGIAYGESVEKAREVLLRVANSNELILKEPKAPNAVVEDLGESSVNMSLYAWTLPENYWTAYYGLNQQVYEAFLNANIEIPFNQMDVHLKKEE